MDIYCSVIHNYQTCKQPRCPLVGEGVGINKLWYIQTIEYYLVLNDLLSHEMTCRNLKCIITKLKKKKRQSEKATFCMIPNIRQDTLVKAKL